MAFSPQELSRYSRHILLKDIGIAGQQKLKNARVLVVGVGGLGAPASQYLAAAGVGHLGLVDFDVIQESNLQRQILFPDDSIGKSKVQTAAQALKKVNPHITIETFEAQLTPGNAADLIEPFDIVLDGTDNFEARYAVSDACVPLKKPNVFGSVFRFEGRVCVFTQPGPCYRCLYPAPPEQALSCAQAGVLGAVAGVVGCAQAVEAVKLITGAGEPLAGKLALFDALEFSWRRLAVAKNPDCPACRPAVVC